MRLWGLHHFFLPSVVKCMLGDDEFNFIDFDQFGNEVAKLPPCSENGSESSTSWNETEWKKNFIYPVNVCLRSAGDINKVTDCPLTSKSRIVVTVDNPTTGESTEVQNIPIDVNRFNDKHFCQVIDASTMAMALRLQGRDVNGTRIKASAKIFGIVMELFRADVGVVSYYVDRPKSFATLRDPNKFQAVVCNFPECIITAHSCRVTKTEKFHIKDNEAPLYEPNAGPLTDGMFSVTYFDCEGFNSPGEIVASKPQPSNASYQLTEALVVTA